MTNQTMQALKIKSDAYKGTALTGVHALNGIAVRPNMATGWNGERINLCLLMIDGTIYAAVEDPSDGYRSALEGLFYTGLTEMDFDSVVDTGVLISYVPDNRYTERFDGFEFRDLQNGKLVLRIGTNYCDYYYPCCIMQWNPENLAVNEHVGDCTLQ